MTARSRQIALQGLGRGSRSVALQGFVAARVSGPGRPAFYAPVSKRPRRRREETEALLLAGAI